MQEDFIELRFNLLEPVRFRIGDYIEDELFGRFVITEKQFPTFNEAAGCYVYALRFDAHYMAWENRMFMLTTNSSGNRIRKETSWILTDKLSVHAQEVINNLTVLGYDGYSYSIGQTATHAEEAISVPYDGIGIISALGEMARAFGCEWWIDGKTIHFGKCERGQEYTFSLDSNMYAVTPMRNDGTYANRVYFFGGTQNIPDSYGKTLSFNVTQATTMDGLKCFRDGTRIITPDMLVRGDMDLSGTMGAFVGPLSYSSFQLSRDGQYDVKIGSASGVSFDFGWTGEGLTGTLTGTYTLRYTMSNPTREIVSVTRTVTSAYDPSTDDPTHRTFHVESALPPVSEGIFMLAGSYSLELTIEVSVPESYASSIYPIVENAVYSGDPNTFSLVCRYTYARCPLVFNGTEYTAMFNPAITEAGDDDFSYFCFVSGNSFSEPPSGFGVGSSYTLGFSDGSSDGLDITRIPLSFWSSAYSDPSSLMKIGENRLRLPSSYPGGYMDSPSADGEATVEKAVVLDYIHSAS